MKTFRPARKSPGLTQGHPLQWVVEPLMDEPSYLQRAMFGCLGCYLHGRLMVVLAARREPWQGLLVPTAREHHAALLREEVALCVHPVLSKWLYLAEASDAFEKAAQRLVAWILADDPRIGVEPGQKEGGRGANRAPSEREGTVQGGGGVAHPNTGRSGNLSTFNTRRSKRPK
jgi:hypothetical protein